MDPDRRSAFYEVKRTLRRAHSEEVFGEFMQLGGYSTIAALVIFALHLTMTRILGPADYATYGTFVAILFTAFFALTAIHLIITRFVSYHKSRYQYEQINYIITRTLKFAVLAGLGLFALIALFSARISEFLGISGSATTVIFGLTLWFTLIVPVYEGAYKGLSEFKELGRFRISEAILRLVLTLTFVSMGFGVAGALFGLAMGTLGALIIHNKYIRKIQKLKVVRPNTQEMKRFALPVLLTTTCVSLLLNLDIILVKHFFPPAEAGVFAAASLIAKVPFLVAMVFVGVMFPKITQLHADGKNSAPVLKHALQVVAPIVAVLTVLAFFLAGPVTSLLFGAQYALGPALGFYVFGMGCLGLFILLAVYMLAVRKDGVAYALPFIVLGYLGLLIWLHQSLLVIMVVVMLVMSALLALGLFVARNVLEFDYFL